MAELLSYMVALYLSLCFAKFCLMASTAHVAAAVHLRMAKRHGYDVPWAKCYLTILRTNFWVVLVSTPTALYRERWKYFRAYTCRETMRDILSEYR